MALPKQLQTKLLKDLKNKDYKKQRLYDFTSSEDEILLYYDNPVSFEDVAVMCKFFMINEDKIYPPPRFKGAEMFKEYIKEVLDTRKIPNKNNIFINFIAIAIFISYII